MLLDGSRQFSMPSQLFLWGGGAMGRLIVVIVASMHCALSPTLAPVYGIGGAVRRCDIRYLRQHVQWYYFSGGDPHRGVFS